jgi:hypothetical protein
VALAEAAADKGDKIDSLGTCSRSDQAAEAWASARAGAAANEGKGAVWAAAAVGIVAGLPGGGRSVGVGSGGGGGRQGRRGGVGGCGSGVVARRLGGSSGGVCVGMRSATAAVVAMRAKASDAGATRRMMGGRWAALCGG